MYAWALGRPGSDGVYYDPALEHIAPYRRQLSFFDLVEAHILRSATSQKLPLQRIKRGLRFLKEKYPGCERPLIAMEFLTDGKYLLVRGMLEGDEKPDDGRLVNASRDGQIEMGRCWSST